MALQKITPELLEGRGVTPLEDRPQLAANDLKYRFDQLAKEVIIPVINANVAEQEPLNAVIGEAFVQLPEAVARSQAAIQAAGAALEKAERALALAEHSEDAMQIALEAQLVAGQALEIANRLGHVYSPVTGLYVSVQQGLEDLYGLFRVGGLTADEYAAYGLTADRYASYNMTADDYALRARQIII